MDFEVNRQQIRETRIRPQDQSPTLADGEVRLSVERFAITSNNITYAVAGDMLGYWNFFPTEDPWGRVPAMGFGSVVESNHPDIGLGGRYFGFYSMSSDLVIQAQPTSSGFSDVSEHRAGHAEAYTSFAEVSGDPMFDPEHPDEFLLLRGLFVTSFLIDDYLADSEVDRAPFLGARQTLVTSASSKTSICLAECLARRGHPSVGLTSERNRAFVEGLDLYGSVLTYDEIDRVDSQVPAGVVDMAGNAEALAGVHHHLGDELAFSLAVGVTHWEAGAQAPADMPGPTPEFFFAPTQMSKRSKDWGPAEMMSKIGSAFSSTVERSERWLNVSQHEGTEALTEVYLDLLEGRADPADGHVVSLPPNT